MRQLKFLKSQFQMSLPIGGTLCTTHLKYTNSCMKEGDNTDSDISIASQLNESSHTLLCLKNRYKNQLKQEKNYQIQ